MAKYSTIHRNTVANILQGQLRRLERLRARGLGWTTPRGVLFVASSTPLPAPSDGEAEAKDLLDEATREDFPWLGDERHLPDVGQYESFEELWDDVHSEPDPDMRLTADDFDCRAAALFCQTRIHLEMELNSFMVREFEGEKPFGPTASWKQSFPGRLEVLLNHAELECCTRHRRLLESYGLSRRGTYLIAVTHLERLQDDIDDTRNRLERIHHSISCIDTAKEEAVRVWRRSRTNSEGAASFMRSSGLGSPLVESSTPDDAEFSPDCWEAWEALAKPARKVLVPHGVAASSRREGETSAPSASQTVW
ncbi:uncharacterized protein UV8b_00826 [Ustilaginoidea virens]|uniref:Uncharacterized protein n=1 Tax=Ustilaginoidea virens TaxID=1159556 RepID=A0A1B5L523_USTVR|nr:uncharacterized protein UV8b_00826 [Ustilaginoidea virens]QUC16585.1 hypothetical protein UV8b_00826 [Ustilaginoidea virens]GAO18564.1 hypothetical protein UVI_02012370 [Ustilaginoidea virens]